MVWFVVDWVVGVWVFYCFYVCVVVVDVCIGCGCVLDRCIVVWVWFGWYCW